MTKYTIEINGYFSSPSSLAESTGVYFVYICAYNTLTERWEIIELIYIGKSQKTAKTNLRKELQQHISNGDFDRYMREGERLYFSYAECDGRSLDIIENALIFMQKPRANDKLKDNYNHNESITIQVTGECARIKYKKFCIIVDEKTGKVKIVVPKILQ